MEGESDLKRIYFGISGWSYPDWEGIVYPKPKPKGFHPLELICELVDVVEINSSFYAPVSSASAKSWVKIVEKNPSFCFTAKLWQKFTHQQEEWSKEDEKIFKAGIEPLFSSGLLCCLLVQFPWSFVCKEENFARLKKIASAFQEFPLVVEFRHNSWNKTWFIEWLKEKEIGFASIDQPLFSNSLPPTEIITSKISYVRLHGRNKEKWFKEDAQSWERYDYLYSKEELLEWKERIERLKEKSEMVFVVSNNHFQGKGLVNALELKFFFTKKPVKIPSRLIERYPRLKEIGLPKEPQLKLFS